MAKPTLVAIYARVSTSEQNPEAQLLALREYAARRGFSVCVLPVKAFTLADGIELLLYDLRRYQAAVARVFEMEKEQRGCCSITRQQRGRNAKLTGNTFNTTSNPVPSLCGHAAPGC